MFDTHYLDTDDPDGPSTRPPYWYRSGDKSPCQCPGKNYKLIAQHIGFSDSCYRQWKCLDCGHVFVDFLEG